MFDLTSLPITHPDVYHQMIQGSFSFAKSKLLFSMMALDQVQEQNTKIINGQGGASVFLNLEDESALIRWVTCGLEVDNDDASFHTTSTKHRKDNEDFR